MSVLRLPDFNSRDKRTRVRARVACYRNPFVRVDGSTTRRYRGTLGKL